MRIAKFHAFILALFAAGTVWAMDTPRTTAPAPAAAARDTALEQARAAIDRKDWAGAQDVLRDAVARNPQNAVYHNLYAYSMRMGPNPNMDLVFRHYNEALRIDPKLRGAHEYLGEAYLMSGNVAKAKEHLALLDGLCGQSCEEYTKLKQAVAAYEQQHANK
jgi:Flp pilus assembly protein TadD